MGLIDWLICGGVLLLMFGQGWWSAYAQRTTDDYFVGGRRMGWLSVGLSMFAATFSPLSFVGFPREAAYANYHLYLAILFTPLFAAPLAGWLFVPLYHRLQLTSAYEYLELRFDRRLRLCGSLLMGLYTLSWMGTMLYATGLILQVPLELKNDERIAVMVGLGAVTAVYTTVGGFKAAVWTNVIKSGILAGVIVAVLLLAVARIDGGWSSVWHIGWAHNKFAMFDIEYNLTSHAKLFPAVAFGSFVYLSIAVTSQGAVQRYASLPSVSAGRRMLAIHGIGTALVCLLFFALGTVMFAFYMQNPAGEKYLPPLAKEDQITIHFVRTEIPYAGLTGLLLAGLLAAVMGSFSSGLSSLSSLVVTDWLPGRKLDLSHSRLMSAVFGTLAIGAALIVPLLGERVFHIIIGVSGAFFGPLLGLFLLGALIPRANAAGALYGLIAFFAVMIGLLFTKVDPWWYGAFTCTATFVTGILGSLLFPPPRETQVRGLLVLPGHTDIS